LLFRLFWCNRDFEVGNPGLQAGILVTGFHDDAFETLDGCGKDRDSSKDVFGDRSI
jgi:hypothetical protein